MKQAKAVYDKWINGRKVMSDGMTEMFYEEGLKKGGGKQIEAAIEWEKKQKEKSDGSTASYYELPNGSRELQDLISYKNMNAQIGEIFRECYRYGQASHSDELRGIKKILFYAQAELKRIENK